MMSPDLVGVLARVQEELGEQLDVLEREGGAYAREYAWSCMTRPTLSGPPRPPAMRPEIGKMVRELVLDELAARRIGTRGTTTRPGAGQRDLVAASLLADEQRERHHDVYPRRNGGRA